MFFFAKRRETADQALTSESFFYNQEFLLSSHFLGMTYPTLRLKVSVDLDRLVQSLLVEKKLADKPFVRQAFDRLTFC
jgi:hypothetical protein